MAACAFFESFRPLAHAHQALSAIKSGAFNGKDCHRQQEALSYKPGNASRNTRHNAPCAAARRHTLSLHTPEETDMHAEAFAQTLAQEGFEPPVTVRREADGMMANHTHAFEAKALILEGEIRIATHNAERTYRSGDIFHLPAHEPHTEHYGPEGVTYLVGRKAG
jgi:hypothetical protein